MAINVGILAAALWLFLSAFLWPHGAAQFVNAVFCGLLVVAFELLALGGRKGGHYLNLIVGGWLIVSTLILPWTRVATAWNHVLVGLMLVAGTLLLAGAGSRGQPRSLRPARSAA